MIQPENLSNIGRVLKTHGVNGEMCISLNDASLCADVQPDECLVFEMDGIYVPFFVASSRPRGSESMLITLDGEDSQAKAAAFVGKDIYMEYDEIDDDDSDLDPDNLYASDLVGFTAYSGDEPIGTIADYYDNDDNPLFDVEGTDDKHFLIPIVDKFIVDVDAQNKAVTFDLPDGLLEL